MSDVSSSVRPPASSPRLAVCLVVSVLLHVLLLLFWPEAPKPPEPLVQITVLDDGPTDSDTPAAPGPKPGTPAAGPAHASRPPPSGGPASGERVAAVARPPAPAPAAFHEAPAPMAPVEPNATPSPNPTPTTLPSTPSATRPSFRAWQAAHASPYFSQASLAAGSGGGAEGDGDGGGGGGRRGGVLRCVPPPEWNARMVYLLVDASGSMVTNRAPEARGCAKQFAGAAIERGADVAVVSFARSVLIAPPSHDMRDIDAALLSSPSPDGTVLPSSQLAALVESHRDVVSDIIIISDGGFAWTPELAMFYGRLVGANRGNRGRVFTIGATEHLASLEGLRHLGFEVESYVGFGSDARVAQP